MAKKTKVKTDALTDDEIKNLTPYEHGLYNGQRGLFLGKVGRQGVGYKGKDAKSYRRGYTKGTKLGPTTPKETPKKKPDAEATVKVSGPLTSRECLIRLPDIELKVPKGCEKTKKEFKELYKHEVRRSVELLIRTLATYGVGYLAPVKTKPKATARATAKVKQDGKIHFELYI